MIACKRFFGACWGGLLFFAVSCSPQEATDPVADEAFQETPFEWVQDTELLEAGETLWRAFLDNDGDVVYSFLSSSCRSELARSEFDVRFARMRSFYGELSWQGLAAGDIEALRVRFEDDTAIVELLWSGPSPVRSQSSSPLFLQFEEENGSWKTSELCEDLDAFKD